MKKLHSAYNQRNWEQVIKLGKAALASTDTTTNERKEVYLLVGSALKKSNQIDNAINCLKSGIKEFPDVAGLYHNLGNCYRAQKKDDKWSVIECYLKAQELGLNSSALVASLARTFQDISLSTLAYKTLTTWLNSKPAQEAPNVDILMLLIELAGIVLEESDSERIGSWCLENFGELAKNSREGQASLAIYKARMGETEEAKHWFYKAKDSITKKEDQTDTGKMPVDEKKINEQSLITCGWNLGCSLLKKGDMTTGWVLYNYGLHTPAPGLQRWQRSLQKPFDSLEVPIWCGEPIKNKKILIIGEQAIGDTIMFLQLIPEILKETKSISLLIPDRLVSIYKRTYPDLAIYSDEDLEDIKSAKNFDLQIPCGSIPAIKLKNWLHNGWDQVKIKINSEKSAELRQKYREGLDHNQPLIGISWSGGGKESRKRVKSLTGEQFKDVFTAFPNARFVSLQYGKAENMINEWKIAGYDVIIDKEINALIDMDTWLSQVEACDAVISVANTTIHGAGCIKKPTFCLQGRSSDWRWIDGLDHSYWYESVHTHWQNRDGSWNEAIQNAKKWFTDKDKPRYSKNVTLKTIQKKALFTN